MELSDLYSEKILAIAGNPPMAPRLVDPHASARKVSRVCGSSIEVDICVQDGVIVGYGHELSACALGQTSAAIVAREIVGTRSDAFRNLRRTFVAMLRENGSPDFDEKWGDLRYLEPVRDYPARHMSTLLVFDAVVEALDKLGAQAKAAAPESVKAGS